MVAAVAEAIAPRLPLPFLGMLNASQHQPMTTVRELRQQARQKKVKGYSKLNKTALLSALGLSDEARVHQASVTRRNAIATHSRHLAEGSATKRAQLKGRILRQVKKAVDAARAANPNISQDELRKVAAGAIGKEARAIKAGQAENKPKRGGARAKAEAKQAETKPVKASELSDQQKRELYNEFRMHYATGQDLSPDEVAKAASMNAFEYLASHTGERNTDLEKYAVKSGGRWKDTRTGYSFKLSHWQKAILANHESAVGAFESWQQGGRKKIQADKIADRMAASIREGRPVSDNAMGTYGNHPAVKAALKEAAAKSGDKSTTVVDLRDVRAEKLAALLKSGRDVGADELQGLRDHPAIKTALKELDDRQGRRVRDSKPRDGGKLTRAQEKAIAAHLRAVEKGEKQATPLRALQDKEGQHWLELKSPTGAVGAMPIDKLGVPNPDRAIHGEDWKQAAAGMKQLTVIKSRAPKKQPQSTVASVASIRKFEEQQTTGRLQPRGRTTQVRGISID